MIILGAVGIACLALPFTIYLEHQKDGGWPRFVQAYPHMTLYPALVMPWVCLLMIRVSEIYVAGFRARNPRKALNKILVLAGVMAIAALIVTAAELAGDGIMLFEISPGSVASENPVAEGRFDLLGNGYTQYDTSYEGLREYAIAQLSLTVPDEFEIRPEHRWFEQSVSLKTWRSVDGWMSWSRIVYGLVFWLVVWHILFCFSVFALGQGLARGRGDEEKFQWNLLFALVLLVAWVPFRLYFVYCTQVRLFGEPRFGTLDLVAMVMICLFAFFTCYRLFVIGADRAALTVAAGISAVLGPAVAAFNLYELIDSAFGVNSTPLQWIAWPILMSICGWIGLSWLSAKEG